MYLFAFCIQFCLIQYAVSQRVNGPTIANSGLPYGPNAGLNSPLPGQTLGRLAPEIGGSGIIPVAANQALSQVMPSPYGPGLPNPAFRGMPSPMPRHTAYGGPSMPNPTYGGSGSGDVTVAGELPVTGMTSVSGQVPLTGKVSFNGNVPCGGVVTISGTCSTCGGNLPNAQMKGYGSRPYGY